LGNVNNSIDADQLVEARIDFDESFFSKDRTNIRNVPIVGLRGWRKRGARGRFQANEEGFSSFVPISATGCHFRVKKTVFLMGRARFNRKKWVGGT